MNRILLTGGTGLLGRHLVPRLLDSGYLVRVMSRRAPRPGENAHVEWARADLATGSGLSQAVAGIDVVLHAASSPVKRDADVLGTEHLLNQAREAGASHFVYISIVGIDRIDYFYYRNKLAAEQLIEAANVPWTILRATQFHDFVARFIRAMTRLPLALVPRGWQFQSIDTGETADQLVSAVRRGPSGHLPEIGGPEILSLDEMVRTWLEAQGRRNRLLHLPIPGAFSAGIRQGLHTTPKNRIGKVTWNEWVAAQFEVSALAGTAALQKKA